VFVTHDQEEAMDVADRIFVMSNGKVEQEGSPDELYDAPANDFVMSFLGPATRLQGALVRPHDVELLASAEPDASAARITRIARLGFEVRVEVAIDGAEDADGGRKGLVAAAEAVESSGSAAALTSGGPVWAQLTREELRRLNLDVGDRVFVRPDGRSIARAV
jgi:sulfate transport system ATP-binding protein